MGIVITIISVNLLFVQAGVQMPATQTASYRRHTCCTGMAHSNHGTTLLFTSICGRVGSSQTPPKGSPWYGLRQKAELCRVGCVYVSSGGWWV